MGKLAAYGATTASWKTSLSSSSVISSLTWWSTAATATAAAAINAAVTAAAAADVVVTVFALGWSVRQRRFFVLPLQCIFVAEVAVRWRLDINTIRPRTDAPSPDCGARCCRAYVESYATAHFCDGGRGALQALVFSVKFVIRYSLCVVHFMLTSTGGETADPPLWSGVPLSRVRVARLQICPSDVRCNAFASAAFLDLPAFRRPSSPSSVNRTDPSSTGCCYLKHFGTLAEAVDYVLVAVFQVSVSSCLTHAHYHLQYRDVRLQKTTHVCGIRLLQRF